MSNNLNTYRFMLSIDGTNYNESFPIWGEGKKAFELDSDEFKYFFREKLTLDLKFVRMDYTMIRMQPYGTKFFLRVEEHTGGGNYELFGDCFFFKNDGKFFTDKDDMRFEVSIQTEDRYRLMTDNIQKETDLLKFNLPKQSVNYIKTPILQLFIAGRITNIKRGLFWEQEILEDVTVQQLTDDYKFGNNPGSPFGRRYVTGATENLPFDVSGFYIINPASTRDFNETNRFFLEEQEQGGQFRLVIGDAVQGNRIIFASDFVADPITLTNPRPGLPLKYVDDDSIKVNVVPLILFMRYLSDDPDFISGNTFEIPDSDIVGPTGYNYVSPFEGDNVQLFEDVRNDDGFFGRVIDTAAINPSKYFDNVENTQAPNILQLIPVNPSDWDVASYWFAYDQVVNDLENSATQVITVADAYYLSDVIRALIQQYDDRITHEALIEYSQFLYSTQNPVSLEANPKHLITPKSNIISGLYDEPASKAIITLNELLKYIWYTHQCKCFIDDQSRFRIEHISWFEKGGSYNLPIVGYDLTLLTEAKTGQKWSDGQNIFEYLKADMFAQRRIRWMDEDVSDPFYGDPLDISELYVQRDLIQEYSISSFTSDIDYIQVNAGSVSSEGFVPLAATLENNILTVAIISIAGLFGIDYQVQNGYYCLRYLMANYHRHNLPGDSIVINQQATTSLSKRKDATQEIKFPYVSGINLISLLRSGLGDGQIRTFEIDMQTKFVTANINHDPEL